MTWHYVIALGSNQYHHAHGAPPDILEAAFVALNHSPLTLVVRAKTVITPPLGPSHRCYANSAARVTSDLDPLAMLKHLKGLERHFGRRRGGQRWRARPLDLDIILWSGGIWASEDLTIPHPAFRTRTFVLGPLNMICPTLRDPVSGLSVRHLKARLDRRMRHP